MPVNSKLPMTLKHLILLKNVENAAGNRIIKSLMYLWIEPSNSKERQKSSVFLMNTCAS